MSVYFDIHEHLSLQPGTYLSIAYMVGRRMAALGADMLMGGGDEIYSLRVTKGDRTAEFKGREVTPALKEAICLIMEADEEENTESLTVDAEYHFRWSGGDEEFCAAKSPFPLCKAMGELEEEIPEDLDKFYYVMWNKTDCSDGMGEIRIYGKDPAGKLWLGESPEFKPTEALPNDAKWYNDDFLFSYEGAFTPELTEACRRLSILGGSPYPFAVAPNTPADVDTAHCAPDLTLDGDEGYYILDSVSLNDHESVRAFAEQTVTVLRLTGETEFEGKFFDGGSPLPRMLYLYVNAEGTVRYELAES